MVLNCRKHSWLNNNQHDLSTNLEIKRENASFTLVRTIQSSRTGSVFISANSVTEAWKGILSPLNSFNTKFKRLLPWSCFLILGFLKCSSVKRMRLESFGFSYLSVLKTVKNVTLGTVWKMILNHWYVDFNKFQRDLKFVLINAS